MRYSDPTDNVAKPKWLVQTVADLRRHEGFREFAYPDPLSPLFRRYPSKDWGFRPGDIILAEIGGAAKDGAPWTVGYGFTHGVTPSTRMSKEQASKRLEKELIDHVEILDDMIPSWRSLPLFAQTVLANMAFNLGSRLRPFAPTVREFANRNWDVAADRLTRTLWYKQVGYRARELVERLRTQSVQDKHKVI